MLCSTAAELSLQNVCSRRGWASRGMPKQDDSGAVDCAGIPLEQSPVTVQQQGPKRKLVAGVQAAKSHQQYHSSSQEQLGLIYVSCRGSSIHRRPGSLRLCGEVWSDCVDMLQVQGCTFSHSV